MLKYLALHAINVDIEKYVVNRAKTANHQLYQRYCARFQHWPGSPTAFEGQAGGNCEGTRGAGGSECVAGAACAPPATPLRYGVGPAGRVALEQRRRVRRGATVVVGRPRQRPQHVDGSHSGQEQESVTVRPAALRVCGAPALAGGQALAQFRCRRSGT